MDVFKHRPGEFSASPTFYTPATDRERAIGRLQEMAGDPSKPPTCEEEAEAREMLKRCIREDPALRERLRYWKQFIDAPNGKERLYKEVVLPKLFEQMRFRRTAASDPDYGAVRNISWNFWAPTVDDTMSPWFRGYFWQYPTTQGLWNRWVDNYWLHAVVGFGMILWTRGWYLKYFGNRNAGQMIRYARLSRRYWGRVIPRVPAPAHMVRNRLVVQAITRKMLREGKAHNIHVEQALNSLK